MEIELTQHHAFRLNTGFHLDPFNSFEKQTCGFEFWHTSPLSYA
jgi:hypothetical protein